MTIGAGETITAADVNAILPSGCIVLWSGSIASIPAGWILCNGSGGSPDLRDRFVVGAGSSYAVDSTGGESTHTLTTAEMPSHTHTIDARSGTAGTNVAATLASGTVTPSTGSTGGGGAHENKPPYFALAYIYKS